jgi:hypothetical protein
MTRFRVLPYRQGSKGAKALATALGGKVLKLEGSAFIPQAEDVIINWGSIVDHPSCLCPMLPLNPPGAIRCASNKLRFFRMMRDAGHNGIIPEFWEKTNDIPDDAFPIVCRTVLAGHSGDGIVIANDRSGLVPAPLYVRYIKKELEFRIHVGRKGDETTIISIQRKARNKDVPNEQVNWQVRNHQNGFVYVRQGVNPPACVLDVARTGLLASGLDFGAVDVIYNTIQEKAYVLEINTAPGLEGTTVEDYATFFKS